MTQVALLLNQLTEKTTTKVPFIFAVFFAAISESVYPLSMDFWLADNNNTNTHRKEHFYSLMLHRQTGEEADQTATSCDESSTLLMLK